MNREFFAAIAMLEKENGIPAEYMYEKIKAAIISATKDSYGNRDNVVCEINPEKLSIETYAKIAVVEEVEDPRAEMTLEQARNYDPSAQIGSFIKIVIEPKKFARIVAQTAKSVIRQGIREAEKEISTKEFRNREQENLIATVKTVYHDTGDVRIEFGKSTAILSKNEQIPGEKLVEGQLINVYVASIKDGEKTSYVNISRKHAGLVKRLFEREVSEISDGIVEIKAISREAGSRTKISVSSNDPNVDAVGACIGQKGQRVNEIIKNLSGEKIDIVHYSDDPEKYIAAALAPSQVVSVTVLDEAAKTCRVIVPDNQLSLAIGNKGQNVRLAARLTGWKIDIKSVRNAE